MENTLRTLMGSRWVEVMREADSIAQHFAMVGWKLPAFKPKAADAPKRNLGGRKARNGIRYTDELLAFMATLPPKGRLGIEDFAAFLAAKFPGATLNRESVRSPFSQLEEYGLLRLVQKGAGRKPAIYRKRKADFSKLSTPTRYRE